MKCEDPVESLVRGAQSRFLTLQNNLGFSTEAMKKKVNEKQKGGEVVVGDRVFVKINVRNQLNYKLGPKFEGPFVITECLIGNRYRVKKEGDLLEKVVHISQLKLVRGNKQNKKVRFLL